MSDFVDARVVGADGAEQGSVGTAYSQIVHGEHERREEGADASSVFKFATTYRKASCGCLFCTNLMWLVLTIALALSGLNPINDDNIGEVGLYIPEDEYQQRANAYYAAQDEASLTLVPAKCAREDADDPITLIVMKGSFFRRNKGNALTKSGLETLRSRENEVMTKSGWEDRCGLVYSQTYPQCVISANEQIPTGYNNVTFSSSDENGCQRPFSPVFFFERYGDPNFEDIPGTISRMQANTVDWLSFTDLLHKDFTASNMRSKVLVSRVYAGTPRHPVEFYVSDPAKLARIEAGFSVEYYDTKHETREDEHLENWIQEELLSDFEKNFEKTPYRTLFSYAGYDPISDIVIEDLSLLIVALLLVILYMWYYTGSLFITGAGIFQVLMSFFGANLLYRYCWPTSDGLGYNFFTLFCALALFIIMGIGADDIFVYWDTWNGAETHWYKTVAHRMSHVYSHACVAMGVTSATTILAFVSNLSSPFIGIATFGVFSALLVTVNYLAVITFFPCVVLVYEAHFAHRKYWWDPCWQRCKPHLSRCFAACTAPLARCFSGAASPEAATAPGDDDAAADDDDQEPAAHDSSAAEYEVNTVVKNEGGGGPKSAESGESSEKTAGDDAVAKKLAGEGSAGRKKGPGHADYKDPLPLWFRDTYAPFVVNNAKLICGVLTAFWVVFLAFACLLQVAPFLLYELLPSTHNFHQYTFVTERWRTTSSSPLYVHVLYGLDHREPINIHGIRLQNFVPSESGDPEWDTAFDLDSIGAQIQLIKTAEEFAFNPRRGLKIDVSNGINTQLSGSVTGSLENTPDGGASSSLQSPYGVQSLMHAIRQWENVSEVVDADAGKYRVRDSFESTCRPCFDTFTVDPAPATLGEYFIDPSTGTPITELTIDATSKLNDGCQCYGYFPIATSVCLYETRNSSNTTFFKCTNDDESVARQLEQFLEAGDTQNDHSWWTDYAFALGDEFGRYERMALYDIQVQTTLSSFEQDFKVGLRMAKKWDDWMDDHNKDEDNNPLRVMAYVSGSEGWVVSSLLVPSGISNMLLSLFLAWVVLVLATGNFITSSLATVTIGMICTIVLGFIHILGWGLGPLESILIVIVVGFSVDYTVHLADSFVGSKSHTRAEKVADALVHTGSSVLSGAISTLSASIPMFGAQIIFFVKFGAFVFMTIFLSLIFSLGFFCSLLVLVGPLGKEGQVSNLYAGLVESMHKNIQDLEAEQALINASRRQGKLGKIHEEQEEEEDEDEEKQA